MDPEQLREFEESIRRINEMLAQQTAMQAEMLKAMQSNINATTQAAQATRQNLESSKSVANSNKEVADTNKEQAEVGKANTAISRAQKEANTKLQESTGSLRVGFEGLVGGLQSFKQALMSGQEGFAKYGGVLDNVGQTAMQIGSKFGLLGMAAGGATAALAQVAKMQFEQFDAQVKFRDEISRFGGVGAGTTKELANLAQQAGYSYLDLQKLSKPLQTASGALYNMGQGADSGAKTFLKMADVGRETRERFRNLGVSQEELTGYQSQYLALQRMSGSAFRDMAKDGEKLKKNSVEYAENLIRLSTLTGQNADALAQEQMQVKLQLEEQIQSRAENARIRKLDAEAAEARKNGNEQEAKEKEAQAKTLRAQIEGRDAMRNEISSKLGDQVAIQMMKVARTGTFDESTRSLANMGFSAQEIKSMMMASQSSAEGMKTAGALVDKYNASLDKNALANNQALQLNTEFAKEMGFQTQVLERTVNTQGKTAKQADDEFKKKTTEQAPGKDPMLDKRNELAEFEIRAKQTLDKTLSSFDALNILLGVGFTAAVIAATVALGKLASKAAFSGGPGSGGKPSKPGKPTARARIPKGQPGAGRFTKAPKPSMLSRAGSALGKFGRGAGALGKAGLGVLSKAALPLTAAYAVYEGAKAASDAENVLGVKGRKATTGERIAAGAGGALSSLTFGLVGADTIGKGLMKIGSVFGSSDKPVAKPATPPAAAASGPAGVAAKVTPDGVVKPAHVIIDKNISPLTVKILGRLSDSGIESGPNRRTGVYDASSFEKKDDNSLQEAQLKKHNENMSIAKKMQETDTLGIGTQEDYNRIQSVGIEQLKLLQETEVNRSKTEGAALEKFIIALDVSSSRLQAFQNALNSLSTMMSSMGGMFGPPGGDTGGGAGGGVPPGTSPDMQKYLATIAMMESSGNTNAKSSTSSASGLFQFTDATWKETTKAMGKDYSLQDRFDPKKATEVAAFFAEKQKDYLERAIGRPASSADMYMAHFLGQGGAAKFLKAMQQNPNSSAADIVGSSAASANKSIFFDGGRERSLSEVYKLMQNKVGKAESTIQSGNVPEAIASIMQGGGGPGGRPMLANLPKNIEDLFNFRAPSGDREDFAGLNPGMRQALVRAAMEYKNATGKEVTINSAKRQPEDQQRLWDESVRLGTPGRGPGGMLVARPGRSPHESGNAVDVQEYRDPKLVDIFGRYGLTQNYGSKDPVHFELQAMDGGLFTGPTSGYPVELHGTEIVAPLNEDSVLMELAKTSSSSLMNDSLAMADTPKVNAPNFNPESMMKDVLDKISIDAVSKEGPVAPVPAATGATDAIMDSVLKMNGELLSVLTSKLDEVIDKLETGNDVSDKLLKRTSV